MPYPVIPVLPTGQTALVAAPNSITASATASSATCTATIAAQVGLTNYITGFAITSAPAAATPIATITGLLGGTLSFQVSNTAAFGAQLIVSFPQPIPATGQNVAIVVSCPTTGAASAVDAYGFAI
jgi:hypothetical protein